MHTPHALVLPAGFLFLRIDYTPAIREGWWEETDVGAISVWTTFAGALAGNHDHSIDCLGEDNDLTQFPPSAQGEIHAKLEDLRHAHRERRAARAMYGAVFGQRSELADLGVV